METTGSDGTNQYAVDISSIKEARDLINSIIHKTPVLSSETLNYIGGRRLLFKCECFQKGGAFKFRVASNAIFSLDQQQATKGVVTHSSGNHAAVLALAAKIRGIPAYIVIPDNALKCKVQNVIRYGGRVIRSESTMQSRHSTASKVLEETAFLYIHTVMDVLSGGGLISGVALAAKTINPAIRVLAAEPVGANDAALSKEAGRIITLPQTNTVADGLRASLGDLNGPLYEILWMTS